MKQPTFYFLCVKFLYVPIILTHFTCNMNYVINTEKYPINDSCFLELN